MRAEADAMAREGLRVLGVARAAWAGGDLPGSPRGFAFDYLGLAGLADPLRAGVPQAVAQCQRAGIRVVMITGDYPATADAIARQAGLEGGTIVTGDAMSGMDDATLAAQARSTTVFARIMPEQKLRIVAALKADGEVVAMGSPQIAFRDPQQMAVLVALVQDSGGVVANSHTTGVREVGIKRITSRDVAFKRDMDPYGLLNPGKLNLDGVVESTLQTSGWRFRSRS
jgi:hypothetical protein